MIKLFKPIALALAAAIIISAACACSVRRIDSDGKTNESAAGVGRDVSTGDAGAADTKAADANAADTTAADQTSPPETEQVIQGAGRTIVPVPANADEAFEKTVFVGDSICSGLRVYGFMPDNNCLAEGSVGAWSIFNYNFTVDGMEYDLITALTKVDPSFVVFSMGMNDINITDEDGFLENYDEILSKTHEALPDAKLFVCSITPTLNAESFKNSRIDSFNEAMSKHLEGSDYYFIDVTSYFKDASSNSLKEEYSAGDGIHLSTTAYEVLKNAVYEFYKSIGASK